LNWPPRLWDCSAPAFSWRMRLTLIKLDKDSARKAAHWRFASRHLHKRTKRAVGMELQALIVIVPQATLWRLP
jgi:hypothetical protein